MMTPQVIRETLIAMMETDLIEHMTIDQRRAVDGAISLIRAKDLPPLKHAAGHADRPG